MKKLTVLTLNCYGAPQSRTKEIRFQLIAEKLVKLQPNIILLQEVITKSQRLFLTKALKKEGYKVYKKKNAEYRTGGIIVFSNLDLDYEGFIQYKIRGSPFFMSATDRFLLKGFQSFELKMKKRNIRIINTHMLTSYINRQFEWYCVSQQLNQLLDYLIESDKDHDLIVGGDFNVDFDTHLYRFLVHAAGMFDPLAHEDVITLDLDNQEANYLLKKLYKRDLRIDYTFLKGFDKRRVHQEIVFDKPIVHDGKQYFLSDHYGVYTVIGL